MTTSPVGVVVFDGATGEPKSFNREARRIVDSLRNPGQSPEDLLNLLTFRRADGREVSLREFPMAEIMSTAGVAETVRAEEVVLGVPDDGRSVTVLLNATPILSDEGAVESMVVAMQDMAAVEEQERLRAEFLGMVSHELRTPLTSIMGSASAIMNWRARHAASAYSSKSGSSRPDSKELITSYEIRTVMVGDGPLRDLAPVVPKAKKGLQSSVITPPMCDIPQHVASVGRLPEGHKVDC